MQKTVGTVVGTLPSNTSNLPHFHTAKNNCQVTYGAGFPSVLSDLQISLKVLRKPLLYPSELQAHGDLPKAELMKWLFWL
jgi:hypothetical protein